MFPKSCYCHFSLWQIFHPSIYIIQKQNFFKTVGNIVKKIKQLHSRGWVREEDFWTRKKNSRLKLGVLRGREHCFVRQKKLSVMSFFFFFFSQKCRMAHCFVRQKKLSVILNDLSFFFFFFSQKCRMAYLGDSSSHFWGWNCFENDSNNNLRIDENDLQMSIE